MTLVPFNRPPLTGNEQKYVLDAMGSQRMSGDGVYGRLCESWFEDQLGAPRVLLTPSCTAALEMAAILIDIKPGDEVIVPSYTFVSTANAFVLRGAKIVFVDIRPDTMNIDEQLIEGAITARTKAIVVVHYAGVACEMDMIMDVANRHGLVVVEDAAQAMMAKYRGRALGAIAHLGAYSFHETKNYTSGGEGGALVINDPRFVERSEILREKGTNRSKYFRGQIDKYTWVDVGSSFLPSELQAAYLWGQLQLADDINAVRLRAWDRYFHSFSALASDGAIELPTVPRHCAHNAHMFYIKVSDLGQRSALIDFLKNNEIMAVFHYVPLHTAPAGIEYGEFVGQDIYTSAESQRLLRLPLYYGISESDLKRVVDSVIRFFR